MASVKEIAEHFRDNTKFDARQKAFFIKLLYDTASAIDSAKVSRPKRLRSPKDGKLMTLNQWEATHGVLSIGDVERWAISKKLNLARVRDLIEEFRTEMVSKNKQYADFGAAFKVYLTKGYLSQTLEYARMQQYKAGDVRNSVRGVSL